jgi:hypothetical protein
MAITMQKNIRITSGEWDRIETATTERNVTANQLLIELAMEPLDGCEWPRTKLEIPLLRSCIFRAQAVACDMITAGRQGEVEKIRRNISAVIPELPAETIKPDSRLPESSVAEA